MDILSKIQKIIKYSNRSYFGEMNDLIYAGKVVYPGAVRQLPMKCAICEKTFKVGSDHINYFYGLEPYLYLMCDKCYQKYLDSWTVVSCERIEPNEGYFGGGMAYGCKMKDGAKKDLSYGNHWSTGEIPKIFGETLKPFIKRYYDELAKKEIKEINIEDTYDVQVIHVEFGNGKKYDIHFKLGTNGKIIYNPNDLGELNQEEIDKINNELQAQGYFRFGVRK